MKKNKLFLSLSAFLLITLIITSLIVNVKGVNTLDFTFENNIFYEATNPSIDKSINLRNQTIYTGHYNATFSFEEDVNGSNPANFSVDETGGTINVISTFDGHDKVIEMADTSDSAAITLDTNVSRVYGTYEYWMRFSQTTGYVYHYILDTDTAEAINLQWSNAGQIKFYNISWNVIDTYDSNVWYHINIDFECGSGNYLGLNEDTFNLRINGKQFGPYEIRGNPTTMEKIRWTTSTTTVSVIHIDALGYSWNKIKYSGTYFDITPQDINPRGITWDDSNFWIVGSNTNEVYKYYANGTYTGTHFDVSTQDTLAEGIVWDGSNFWVVGNINDEVYKYYANGTYTGTHFDVGAQDITPIGIIWDGNFFWVVGSYIDKVYKYYANGTYTGTYFDVGTQDITPTGITWDSFSFWIVGLNTHKVYQYTNEGVYTGTYFDVSLEDVDIGITWDGSNFWCVNSFDNEIYKYLYVEFPYNINDNIIPYNYKSDISEIDKWEFFNNEDGTSTDYFQQDIPYFNKLATKGYIIKNIDYYNDETGVYIRIAETTHEGLTKTFNVENAEVIEININMAFLTHFGTAKAYTYYEIKSYDGTLICKLRVDDSALWGDIKLYYYYDGNYIFLDDLIDFHVLYFIDITIIQNLVYLKLNYTTIDVPITSDYSSYIIPTIINNKNGLQSLKIGAYGEFAYSNNMDLGIDFIGVYIDGKSLSNDFSNYYYALNNEFNNKRYNSIEINASGYFGMSVISFEPLAVETFTYFIYQNISNITYVNVYSENEKTVENAFLSIAANTTFQINYIRIYGIKMTEGLNDYIPSYETSGIQTNLSYFWVNSNNRLQFNLTADDNDLEYIQIQFNIDNIPTEDRSLSFTSNINGNSKGYFALNYRSERSSIIEFPYYETSTKIILPQTETIDKFTILITDNNLEVNDLCIGYISNIELIYNPDVGITIIISTLIQMIIPLIVMILPSIIMSKKFGISGLITTFILMSLICVITNLIPIWLFFIIAFGSITFLLLKREGVIK